MRIFAIVRRMLRIAFEGYRIRNFAGHRPDFYLDPKRSQSRHKCCIKVSHGLRLQRQSFTRTPTRLDAQFMVDEIKLDFKNSISIRDRGSGKPARIHVERNLPPVIDARSQSQSHLAGNLRPHVKRFRSAAPVGPIQFGPEIRVIERHGLNISRVRRFRKCPCWCCL